MKDISSTFIINILMEINEWVNAVPRIQRSAQFQRLD